MRSTCPRCLRPDAFCVCRDLRPVDSRTRVILLQHPREARLAICSAWLTRIALVNAELHSGVRFAAHRRVQEIVAVPGTALLYPGPGSSPIGSGAAVPPFLIVIDGTWKQSEKMLAANPAIAALPRLAIAVDRGSGYSDLRREPAPHCLSTIEAVAHALALVEHDEERFAPMRAAFRLMVERQLACSRDGRRSPRHRRPVVARPA